jgi:hypothetical protein
MDENTRRWKDLPCSWIGRNNIVKMTMLPKPIYGFNVPVSFLTEREDSILKFM